VPRYVALGVTTLKIQGREYPTPVISQLTKIYSTFLAQILAGKPDVPSARAALDKVLPDRDEYRKAKTQQLNERLLARIAEVDGRVAPRRHEHHGKVCYACGAPEGSPHRSSVEHVETTDWDPDSEEAHLLHGERTA
jgi:collagenase-like PrtC family protease